MGGGGGEKGKGKGGGGEKGKGGGGEKGKGKGGKGRDSDEETQLRIKKILYRTQMCPYSNWLENDDDCPHGSECDYAHAYRDLREVDVCIHELRGQCKFGLNCNKSHIINENENLVKSNEPPERQITVKSKNETPKELDHLLGTEQ